MPQTKTNIIEKIGAVVITLGLLWGLNASFTSQIEKDQIPQAQAIEYVSSSSSSSLSIEEIKELKLKIENLEKSLKAQSQQ